MKRRPGAVTELAIQRAMEDIDPQLALAPVRGIDDVRSAALSRQRIMMLLVAGLGGLALFLAAIGIHALISSGVTERTRELGIRMALGATVSQTIRDAALPGIVMAVAGLVIGCAIAYGASGLDAQPALGRERQRSDDVRGSDRRAARGRDCGQRAPGAARQKTGSGLAVAI